jgi:uncharacterized OB-fold protein
MRNVDIQHKFAEPYDDFAPKWQQVVAEKNVYIGYQCKKCLNITGNIPKDNTCSHCNSKNCFEEVEVDEDLILI